MQTAKTKILLIDDEAQVLVLLRTVLERAGHKVATASNGEEGLRILRQDNFGVIITDLFMDTQDGISTIMQMRKENRKVPIIAMSGGGWSSGPDYLKVAKKMGASHTFTKPVSNEELLKAIEVLTTNKDS